MDLNLASCCEESGGANGPALWFGPIPEGAPVLTAEPAGTGALTQKAWVHRLCVPQRWRF